MPGTTTTRKTAKVAKSAAVAKKPARKSTTQRAAGTASAKPDEPKLLSGGNPQIPKGYGDAPVQAYIAAMSGWKRDLWRRLDALIEETLPGVRKAVKWNSPLYGAAGDGGWFLGVHALHQGVVLPRLVAQAVAAR